MPLGFTAPQAFRRVAASLNWSEGVSITNESSIFKLVDGGDIQTQNVLLAAGRR